MRNFLPRRRFWQTVVFIVALTAVSAVNSALTNDGRFFPVHADEALHLISAVHFVDSFRHPSFFTLKSWLHIGYPWPPFFYFSAALLSAAGGTALPVFLSVQYLYLLLLLAGVFLIGRQVHSRRAGYLSCLILLAYPIMPLLTNIFMLELAVMSMTAFSVAALLASRGFANRRWSLILGIALGLGMLIKWTFFLYVGPLVIGHAVQCRTRGVSEARYMKLCFVVALVVLGPWYGYHALSIVRDSVGAGIRVGAPIPTFSLEGIMFYARSLSFEMGACLSLVALVAFFGLRPVRLPMRFLGLWFAVPYVMLTLIPSKWGHYITPVLPAAAVVSSVFIWQLYDRRGWARGLALIITLLVVGLYFDTMAAGVFLNKNVFRSIHTTMLVPEPDRDTAKADVAPAARAARDLGSHVEAYRYFQWIHINPAPQYTYNNRAAYEQIFSSLPAAVPGGRGLRKIAVIDLRQMRGEWFNLRYVAAFTGRSDLEFVGFPFQPAVFRDTIETVDYVILTFDRTVFTDEQSAQKIFEREKIAQLNPLYGIVLEDGLQLIYRVLPQFKLLDAVTLYSTAWDYNPTVCVLVRDPDRVTSALTPVPGSATAWWQAVTQQLGISAHESEPRQISDQGATVSFADGAWTLSFRNRALTGSQGMYTRVQVGEQVITSRDFDVWSVERLNDHTLWGIGYVRRLAYFQMWKMEFKQGRLHWNVWARNENILAVHTEAAGMVLRDTFRSGQHEKTPDDFTAGGWQDASLPAPASTGDVSPDPAIRIQGERDRMPGITFTCAGPRQKSWGVMHTERAAQSPRALYFERQYPAWFGRLPGVYDFFQGTIQFNPDFAVDADEER